KEYYTLSMLVSGNDKVQSWMGGAEKSSFFTLKRYAQMLLKRFGLDFESGVTENIKNEIYSEGISLKLHGKHLLDMGVVSKKIRDKFDIKNDTYYLELNIDAFITMLKTVKIAAKELSKFPEVKRDLALMVDENVSFAALKEVAKKTEKKLLKSISLFDVYQGDKLPAGKKSYALNFVLEDTSKTLTDGEIEHVMSNLIFQFEKNCGAVVRK
ncbi:MAG: phenylalanine--tRNA ligase subunit beta, partial [Rikenellaceae bacterium]